MTAKKRVKTPTLRELNSDISPNENPLLFDAGIKAKDKYVSAGVRKELLDPSSGEVQAMSCIHRIKKVDDTEFVKVFSEGVKAMYGLTKTGIRVFQAILDEYQGTKMNGGFADSIYIRWFNGGLCGRDLGFSERTFHTGLKELLLNKFIAPRAPNLYWVNPALFFKGDRVALIREYRKKSSELKYDGDTHLQ